MSSLPLSSSPIPLHEKSPSLQGSAFSTPPLPPKTAQQTAASCLPIPNPKPSQRDHHTSVGTSGGGRGDVMWANEPAERVGVAQTANAAQH